MAESTSFLSRWVRGFLEGRLAPLFILVSLAAGGVALWWTPREEEPQIVVPVANVLVSYPGGSAEEVERRVASRLERLLFQIEGVEYVYSMSQPHQAVVTVRFRVGEDRERSLIKLYNQLFQNLDRVTPGIAGWIVKPVEIDDVPIVAVTLYSDRYGTHELYRVAEEVAARLQHAENSARITIHGGEPRVVRVLLDPERLAAHSLSPMEVAGALQAANRYLPAGTVERGNREILVEAGPFLRTPAEVRELMVGVHGGRPVYLRDVADVVDGPDEPRTYSRIGFGPADQRIGGEMGVEYPAVTVAVAKRRGSNAVMVAREIERSLRAMEGTIIPHEVRWRITRDYGATANDKVNELVRSLGLAMVTVIGLIALTMNWRVGAVVALSVPITYSLTLLVNMLAGYTINRVTLFALILALGLLVDNPIVSIDNIYRHLKRRRLPPNEAIAVAMDEVLPPTVLATLSVIVAFIPMFFITGMMGPYMRPMALNVPLAMIASLIVAATITPWTARLLLASGAESARVGGEEGLSEEIRGTLTYRIYRRLMAPLIRTRRNAWWLLAIMGGLFALAIWLALAVVPLKMLPYDNKNELQILIDMPEGTPLEVTDSVAREVEAMLRTVPEVRDFVTITGGASPVDFNGLVRHYYMRRGGHVGDIRVQLIHRRLRRADSHAIALRLRPALEAIKRRTGANLKLIELPPGPPVLSTLVAEVYGAPQMEYRELIDAARFVRARMEQEPGVVDVDDMVEADRVRWVFETDREKALFNGITTEAIAQTVRLAIDGMPAGVIHEPIEQNEWSIVLRLPREARADLQRLNSLPIKGGHGQLVQLGELGRWEQRPDEKTIFHKNQERVVFVTAEMAGRGPAYAIFSLQRYFRHHPLPPGIHVHWRGEGEWKITLEVFRDLGLGFMAALVAIYALLVHETRSYVLPVVTMLSIPLTAIGIMPGFTLLNALTNRPIGGYENPVYFTATAMIGMVVLAGIVIRNGILLIDFIRTATARGRSLGDAIFESGAVRWRPIFLTAGTTMLGAWPITFDPIFSGLAWSLIFGLFVSTAFTLFVIPTTYYLLFGPREGGAAA